MSVDGIRAVDREVLPAVDYLFGMSTQDGIRRGPHPIDMRSVAQQVMSLSPLGPAKSYETVAEMNADIDPSEGTLAYAEGRTYRKSAPSGMAGWVLFLDFIPGAQIIYAIDEGAGTPNAIVATPNMAISASGNQLVEVNVFEANTATPVTIQFPGLSVLTIKTSSGGNVSPGGLQPGPVLGRVYGSTFRLLSDVAQASLLEATEAARDAAQAARDAAQGAAETVVVARYNSKAAVEAATVPAVVKSIELTGYSQAGDSGAMALHKRVDAQPTSGHYIRSTDRFKSDGTTDAVNGGYWKLVAAIVTPQDLGQTTAGVPGVSQNVIIGGYGTWDPNGATVVRPTWVVGVDNPSANIGSFNLDLTGHYMAPEVDGATIIGGLAAYYSAVGPKARLSITAGKDNYNNHISGLLLSDHTDLKGDGSGFDIGDHGVALGGAFHEGTGSMPTIVGGKQTQCHSDYGATIGGQDNIIGSPSEGSGLHSHSGMIGGLLLSIKGRYNAAMSGLANKIVSIFAGAVGGWNNTLGSVINTISLGGQGAVGGRDHVLFGPYSGAIGGQANRTEIGATYSFVIGTRSVAREIASVVQASGRFTKDGDAQGESVVGFGSGTANINMQLTGSGSFALRGLVLGDTMTFLAIISGGRTDVIGDTFSYIVKGSCQNVAGSPAITGTPVVDVLQESDAVYNPVPFVSGTRFGINVSGNAAKTTRFTCVAHFSVTNLLP